MEKIKRFDQIEDYNQFWGLPTDHPLVSVIDFSTLQSFKERDYDSFTFGFYAIFLKDVKCGNMKYGRSTYDYQEGTLVFIAPNQVLSIQNKTNVSPKGWAVLFHPDLLKGSTLYKTIRNYTYFSYLVNEALHISEPERQLTLECFKNIQDELHNEKDAHQNKLILSILELFLNYCNRFYERQFNIRKKMNSDILSRFENILDEYIHSDALQKQGLPSVKYCAQQLNISANYLGDLLKKETGKNAREHIQWHLIDFAKEMLLDSTKSISEISYQLGYEYPQYFSRMFKNIVKLTPSAYQKSKAVKKTK